MSKEMLTSAEYLRIAANSRIAATRASSERIAAIFRERAIKAETLAKLAKLGPLFRGS